VSLSGKTGSVVCSAAKAGVTGVTKVVARVRSGAPEEVAAAIAFLTGDDSSYVTGQTLNVSDGLSMW
jgi:NAD(P)-dependent dehydrogenase (short-subunit alcohol dehydrogenase family)